jgi:hypothetical protein
MTDAGHGCLASGHSGIGSKQILGQYGSNGRQQMVHAKECTFRDRTLNLVPSKAAQERILPILGALASVTFS